MCTKSQEKPTYILIDELDRCSPEYAVKFLEIIHHFFSVKGLVFIIAIDKEQLKCYVEKIYGVENERFEGWYTKFIKTTYELESIWKKITEDAKSRSDEEELKCEYISQKISKLFPELDKYLGNKAVNAINKILQPLDLSLRNINIFLKSLKRWYNPDESDYKRTIYELQIAAFFIALKLSDDDCCKKIIEHLEKDSVGDGSGKYGFKNIIELLQKKELKIDGYIKASFAKIDKGIDINRHSEQNIEMENLYETFENIKYKDDRGVSFMYNKKLNEHGKPELAKECLALTIHKEIEKMQNFS